MRAAGGEASRRALSALLAATLAACAPPASEDARPLEPVHAVVMPYLTNVPFEIAAAEGLFEKHGLQVEFTRVARSLDLMAALASGDVDVASSMLAVNELNLIASGARLRMIAALGDLESGGCAFAAIIARRELQESGALRDPERIRQLRFDIDSVMPLAYWTEVHLRRFNVDVDALQVTYVPPPATVAAMSSGNIDVTVESEPYVSLLAATGDTVQWANVGDLLPGYAVSLLMFGPTLLDERPGVGERLTAALLEAIAIYREGKTDRNLAIVQHATGLTREQAQGACWPVLRADPRIDPEVFVEYQEWNVAHELVDRVLAPEEYIDQRFLDRAHQILGR